MLPPVHLGVGYLLYAGLHRLSTLAPLRDASVLAVVAGTALPDLVDQTLYRLVDLPSTRTLGHSLLFLGPVCALAWVLGRRTSLDGLWPAFAVGALSHPAADALWPLVVGEYDELGFLLWPVTESPPYEGVKPLGTVGGVDVTTVWIELPLLVTALVVWWRDGLLGLGPVRDG